MIETSRDALYGVSQFEIRVANVHTLTDTHTDNSGAERSDTINPSKAVFCPHT